MATYRIDDGFGQEITVGLRDREEALRVAQRMADEREETLYVSRDVEGGPTTIVEPRTLERETPEAHARRLGRASADGTHLEPSSECILELDHDALVHDHSLTPEDNWRAIEAAYAAGWNEVAT